MGGGDFKLVGFNQATGLVWPLRRKICLNPVWLGGTKPVGLIESCSQGVGALRPKPQGGFAARMYLEAPPQTPFGLRPKPRSGRGLGAGAPSGVWGGDPTAPPPPGYGIAEDSVCPLLSSVLGENPAFRLRALLLLPAPAAD